MATEATKIDADEVTTYHEVKDSFLIFEGLMWDCLVKFSTWAEGNSGQIQIVIAVVALFFAFLGYKKVLKQIEISNKQEIEAEKNRFYELKLNLIKAVNDESSRVQFLHDEFINSVDMYFLCRQNFTIRSKELNTFLDDFYREVLSDRGVKNLDVLKTRMEFLDDTFVQIRNPDLKTEHIEKILNMIFESNLIIVQIGSDLERMKNVTEAIKSIGKK